MTSELEHYRREAAQLRAALVGIVDPLVAAQMREIAEHFDSLADRLEQAKIAAPPVRDGADYRREAWSLRATMTMIEDKVAVMHLREILKRYEARAVEADKLALKLL